MKIKAVIFLAFSVCVSLGCLCGCASLPTPACFSDSLYVRQIPALPEDFILGMDASSVPSLEKSGVTYYGFDGKEADVFQILSQNGINYIRVRVWVDPFDASGNGYGGGNCNIDTALEIGKRATKYGMKLLVDFHYSDFWADPSKQMTPKAWEGMDIDEKAAALGEYTAQSLQKLRDAKVDVGMVQLGNETNGKLCGETIWMNIYKLMNAGSEAIRSVFPQALIAVHFTNPESADTMLTYAKKLDYYQLDYDVFASSYYPYWHGTLENLSAVLTQVSQTYGKKVMVAETSYAFTPEDSDFFGNTIGEGGTFTKSYPFTLQGQANSVVDVVDTVANRTENGIGVFYWEGTWISAGGSSREENEAKWDQFGSGWASSFSASYDPDDAGKYHGGSAVDNQAFFDSTGHALESLKVFSLLRTGNILPAIPDAIEDAQVTCDLNGEIRLPETVNAIMTDNSRQAVPVRWDAIDETTLRSGGPRTYPISGTAEGMTAYCYLSMTEYNFLKNGSFEDGEDGSWNAQTLRAMDELYIEEKAGDSLTGDWHYHFWSAAQDSVEFTLEQTVSQLPEGKYKYSISIMGGDAGETDIYAYVKVNGETVSTRPMTVTSYGSWDTGVIESIVCAPSDTVTVGIYVKCAGAGNGAWGKIDDAMLSSMV